MSIQKEIEEELYTALQALESGDLVRARGCTARAHAGIIESWQQLRKETKKDNGTVPQLVEGLR